MSLSTHLLSRESFWARCQGNLALHSADTPTLPICLQNNSSSHAPTSGSFSFQSSLPLLYHASVFLDLSPWFFLFSYLFLEAELVRDFHSWLADLKLERKDCSNQSGDVAMLGAKLQRMKVLLLTYFIDLLIFLLTLTQCAVARVLWFIKGIFKSVNFQLFNPENQNATPQSF